MVGWGSSHGRKSPRSELGFGPPFPWVISELDCLIGMRETLGPESVDVVVTSPPYTLTKPHRALNDSRRESDYLRWIGKVSSAVYRVLTEEGSLFLNLAGKRSDSGWPLEVLHRFTRKFHLHETILWMKGLDIDSDALGRVPTPRGHARQVSTHRSLTSSTEFVFHLRKQRGFPAVKSGIGYSGRDESNPANSSIEGIGLGDHGRAWFVPSPTHPNGFQVRGVFPPKLPRLCIQLHGVSKTRRVMDPFVGNGSSAVASIGLNIPFVGFDIDRQSVALARKAAEEAQLEFESGNRELTRIDRDAES